MNRGASGPRKGVRHDGLRKQIAVAIFLLVVLALETFFLAWKSSDRLVSSVSDVWQGILESRGEQINDILFEKNPYLAPDTLYLAKLEPAFYEDSAWRLAAIAQKMNDVVGHFQLAISNITTNIKKGISYSSSLRSCYWMLEDEAAPYVLINGTPTPKADLNDDAWIDFCRGMDGDLSMQWRTMPLSYLNNTDVFTVYRRVVCERFKDEGTVEGYWVLNYDLSNVLNALAASMSSSEKIYLYDTRSGGDVSSGRLTLSDRDEAQLLEAGKGAAGGRSVTGDLRNEQGEHFYYRAEELSPGMISVVCLKDVQLSSALDSTIMSMLAVLLISSVVVAAINIDGILRYRKYNRGLRKMFDALRSREGERTETEDPHEATGSEYLLQRILNNEVDLRELQGLVESKQELKAELDALYGHVQINSHFLLNTLDSIYWASVGNTGAFSSESAMIGDLCEILKFALDSSDLYTSLWDEVECARKYIEIQQMRKNISFQVDWVIPKELENARVSKLILQPVIENCIQHGFRMDGKEEASIHISAEHSQDGYLRIRVEDSGCGISEKHLRQMNVEMKKRRYLRSRHIGLANVNRRLQVQFGGDSGVSLYVAAGGGLGVCLTMRYSVYVPVGSPERMG